MRSVMLCKLYHTAYGLMVRGSLTSTTCLGVMFLLFGSLYFEMYFWCILKCKKKITCTYSCYMRTKCYMKIRLIV
jgi:hypothetical protein